MDDISEKIASILSDPESMNTINSIVSSLSTAQEEDNHPAWKGKQPDLSSMLGADSMSMIMKLAPLLSHFQEEDDNTRLLTALRPLLKEERQAKLDTAKKLMQLYKMLPLLKEQGLFG